MRESAHEADLDVDAGAAGPASLVPSDVSTVHFETDTGDGFPLALEAFEDNKPETATMLPTIRAFMAAHHLAVVTVVADAGLASEPNLTTLVDTGPSYYRSPPRSRGRLIYRGQAAPVFNRPRSTRALDRPPGRQRSDPGCLYSSFQGDLLFARVNERHHRATSALSTDEP